MTFVLKSFAGGLVAALIAWAFAHLIIVWRLYSLARKVAPDTLRAVAMPPSYLLTTPWAVTLIAVGFGTGVWLTSHYLARHPVP